LKVAKHSEISSKSAATIIDEVNAGVSAWGKLADDAGVTKKRSRAIGNTFIRL
jgi:hypothetical protein